MRNITLSYCVVTSGLYAYVLVKIYTGHLVVELLMLEGTITLKAVTTWAYSSLWLSVCVSKLLVTLWPFSFWLCGCQTSANMQLQFIVSYCSATFFICTSSISFSWNTAHWFSSCQFFLFFILLVSSGYSRPTVQYVAQMSGRNVRCTTWPTFKPPLSEACSIFSALY